MKTLTEIEHHPESGKRYQIANFAGYNGFIVEDVENATLDSVSVDGNYSSQHYTDSVTGFAGGDGVFRKDLFKANRGLIAFDRCTDVTVSNLSLTNFVADGLVILRSEGNHLVKNSIATGQASPHSARVWGQAFTLKFWGKLDTKIECVFEDLTATDCNVSFAAQGKDLFGADDDRFFRNALIHLKHCISRNAKQQGFSNEVCEEVVIEHSEFTGGPTTHPQVKIGACDFALVTNSLIVGEIRAGHYKRAAPAPQRSTLKDCTVHGYVNGFERVIDCHIYGDKKPKARFFRNSYFNGERL